MTTDREISAGIVVFRRTPEGPKFLVLYHGHNYWNFAKGKIETEEKNFEAALRETREETGLLQRDLRIVKNFRAYERFTFRRAGRSIFKTVIFYLAETDKREVRLSKEHEGYGWFLFSEARKILGKYRDSQKVLKNAFETLQGPSIKRRVPNTQRTSTDVQASSNPRRTTPGLPSSR